VTRLDLRPMEPGDVDALFPVLSDPALWTYDPSRRHRTRAETATYVQRAAARWASDGLSYWTVRLAGSDEVVGTGGAQRHPPGHWNLLYRVAAAHQGRGIAGELLAAALAAAAETDPDLPCIAWIDATNPASLRVADRGGLVDRGLRHGCVDGVVRHAWSDRALDRSTYPEADLP
jgi:RimJ/RimL family protein N-acetyltransferase